MLSRPRRAAAPSSFVEQKLDMLGSSSEEEDELEEPEFKAPMSESDDDDEDAIFARLVPEFESDGAGSDEEDEEDEDDEEDEPAEGQQTLRAAPVDGAQKITLVLGPVMKLVAYATRETFLTGSEGLLEAFKAVGEEAAAAVDAAVASGTSRLVPSKGTRTYELVTDETAISQVISIVFKEVDKSGADKVVLYTRKVDFVSLLSKLSKFQSRMMDHLQFNSSVLVSDPTGTKLFQMAKVTGYSKKTIKNKETGAMEPVTEEKIQVRKSAFVKKLIAKLERLATKGKGGFSVLVTTTKLVKEKRKRAPAAAK